MIMPQHKHRWLVVTLAALVVLVPVTYAVFVPKKYGFLRDARLDSTSTGRNSTVGGMEIVRSFEMRIPLGQMVERVRKELLGDGWSEAPTFKGGFRFAKVRGGQVSDISIFAGRCRQPQDRRIKVPDNEEYTSIEYYEGPQWMLERFLRPPFN